MKKHPAKNARFLVGCASAAGVVVVGAGVLDNALVKVDYTQTLNEISTAAPSIETTIDLSGSATTATTQGEQLDETPATETTPAVTAPLAPTTQQTPKPVATTKSKAS